MDRPSAGPEGRPRGRHGVFAAALAIIVADQLVKRVITHVMEIGESVDFLGTVVRFTRTANTGAAFGVLKGRGLWFIVISAAASVAIVAFSREIAKRRKWEQTAFGLILGGAVGNLIDRIRLGSVIDFIDIGVNQLRWPAFNVADSAITIGVTILAWSLIFLAPPTAPSPARSEQEQS